MGNPISILINGQLNVTETAQQLRTQISQLQRQVGSVQINANVNSSQINGATRQINNLTNATRDAHNATQSFFDAFGKVAVWGIVTGSVYGTIRAFKDMVGEIVTVDSKLTELRRVTNQGFPINKTLQDAIQLSSQLGNNLNDVLDTINGFAAAGNFSEQQLIQLTKVATVASNVSDLKPQDAMGDIIATMRAYGIEAQNTMSIVDKMNEVDNNYSITTVQIAESLKKASSTAKTFGVDINHLIADTTAIGQVTQESGSVIGNSLKTLYSRLTTVGSSVKTLEGLGIAIKDSNGEMRSASSILDDLANKWGTLNKAQQEQAAVSIAGRYQLSRFIALMTQHDQETQALTTSINSQGSAMRENAKYMDSIQAKINTMKNAFAELSLTLGKAFVSDSLVALVQGFTGLATAGAHVVQTFGGLPSLITAAYVAFLLFGGESRKFVTSMTGVNAVFSRFRNIVTDMRGTMGALRSTIEEETVGMTGLSRSLTIAGISARAFGTMFKEALIGTGVGAAIVLVSIGIEKLIEAFSNAQEKQRQLKEQQDQLTQSFNNNKDTIETLAKQYEGLSNVSDSLVKGTQDNKDYLSVQKRLGNLLPSVVSSIDDTGQAHLKSADAVKQEIAQLDKLNNLKSTKFVEDFSKSLSDINNKINDTKNTINNIGKTAYSGYGTSIDVVGQQGSLSTDDKINKIMDNMQLQQQIQQRVDLFKQLSSEYAKSIGVEDKLTNADKKYLNQLVDNNKGQLASVDGAKKFQDQLQNTVSIVGDLRNSVGKGIDVSKIFPDLSKNTSEQEKQLAIIDDSIKKYSDGSMSAKQFADALSKVGISGSKAKDILKSLTTVQQSNLDSTQAQIDAQNVLQGVLNGTSKIEDVLGQELVGYTAKEIDQQTQLVQLYNALSQVTNKNAQQMALYNQVKAQLIQMFPEELKGQNLSLVGMENEVNARKVMSQAAVDSASNRMSAENQVTYNLALNLQKQEQIIKAMIQNYEKLMMSAVTVDPKNGAVAMNGVAMYWYNKMKEAESQLSSVHASYISDVAKLAKGMNYSVPMPTSDFPGTSSSSGSSKKGKSSSGSSGSGSGSSSTPVAQYQTDKYQQSLDALDLKIKQVDEATQKLDHTSKGYIDGLKEEISLTKQKESVVNSEISSLEKRDTAIQKQLKSMGSFNKLSNAQKQTYNSLSQELDQNTQKINQLKDANIGFANDMASIQGQITQVYSDLADQVVQIEKDAYEKKRQIALDANQKQMDDLDKQHTQTMQNYDDEMTKYQDVIDQKTKALDKASSDRSYNEDLTAKQKAAQDTLNQINVMKLDTSPEGQAKLADLQKQYAQEQQDLADTTYQHGVDLQKQNLQDQGTAYQKDIDAKKNAEDAKYNAAKAELQKEQDAINKYYDNIANDDRKWAKLHKDVMDGHFDQVKKDFKNFTDILKGHMDELGKSITQNLLDTLTAASKEMDNLTKSSAPSSGSKPPSSGSKSGSSSTKKPTSSGSSHPSSGSSSSSKKNRYYTVKKGDTLSDIAEKYYGHGTATYYDKIAKANHLKNPNDISIGERLLIPYNTGGYTGSWGSDGRLALLHQKELVLNSSDTSNMLKMVNIVRDMIPKLDLTKIGDKIGNTIHMPITIQNLNGGKEGAMELFNIIGNQMKIMGVNN